MTDDKLKTVEDVEDSQETEKVLEPDIIIEDPIIQVQREDVSKMRTSLLSCNGDMSSVRQAMTNITILRVYHELTRIIRYTELMDKLENKMYESMEHTIDTADVTSASTWLMFMEMQKNLQKSMATSYALLKPYLSISKTDVSAMTSTLDTNTDPLPLDTKSRDNVRATAQAILALLGDANG